MPALTTIVALFTLATGACHDPRWPWSQADWTYEIHCGSKYTASEALALLGRGGYVFDMACTERGRLARLEDGCLSPGPDADPKRYPHAVPDVPLGTVQYESGLSYPGDARAGYVCCACGLLDEIAVAIGDEPRQPRSALQKSIVVDRDGLVDQEKRQ